MGDKIIRAVAGRGALRAFFANTRETVETARLFHNLSPVASAALGRLLTAALIMGLNIKEEDGLVTLQIKGGGPLGGILAAAKSDGTVKGYAENPSADLPLNKFGKLDVSRAVGNGALTVIKDLGLKEPYIGQIPLVTGEIAEDLTAYFAQSEQTPSAVGLGVLVDRDYTIKRAGGFMVQLLPFAEEEVIARLEDNISKISGVTSLYEAGLSERDLMGKVLDGFNVDFEEEIAVGYRCDCSRERVEKALISLGEKEITELAESGEAELCCHFCDKKYIFTKSELERLIT